VNGSAMWTHYAFLGMAFFAAMYHIVPRLTEIDWPSARLSKVHFGLSAAGIIVVTLALLLGGFVQGNGINTPSVPFVDVARRVVPFIGIHSIGLILLLIAQCALLFNLATMIKGCCAGCCGIGAKEVAR